MPQDNGCSAVCKAETKCINIIFFNSVGTIICETCCGNLLLPDYINRLLNKGFYAKVVRM